MKKFSPLHTSMTVRAEDLEVGDRFYYENNFVAVQTISLTDKEVVLRLEMFVLGRCVTRLARVYRELFISIVR